MHPPYEFMTQEVEPSKQISIFMVPAGIVMVGLDDWNVRALALGLYMIRTWPTRGVPLLMISPLYCVESVFTMTPLLRVICAGLLLVEGVCTLKVMPLVRYRRR